MNVIDSLIGLGITDMGRLKELSNCSARDWKLWVDRYVDFDAWEFWTLKRALAIVASTT